MLAFGDNEWAVQRALCKMLETVALLSDGAFVSLPAMARGSSRRGPKNVERHALMCELFAMSARAPVRVRYDLDSFAKEGGERYQNRDGWGIVIAEGRDAHYYREAAPASSSPLDRFVREHSTPHAAVMAHVRRASFGARTLANTHPFRRVQNGRVHHFAYNGTLKGLETDSAARALSPQRVGTTDSELALLLLLDRIDRKGADLSDDATRFTVFSDFARQMATFGSANFLWFDGETLFVHAGRRVHETPHGLTPPKPPGLYILRSEFGSLGSDHDCTGARLEQTPGHVVLLASVPLNSSAWEPLEEGTVFSVRNGHILHRETCI